MTTTDDVIISDMPVDLTSVLNSISPGFDWEWSFEVDDDNGDPVDTTGWAVEMDLRETPNGTLIKKLATATGEIVNNPSAGRFDITYSAAASANLGVRQIVFDVKTTDNSGGVDRPFKATILVDTVVTK